MAHSLEPHVWVADFAASVRWYREVLGFAPAARYPDEDSATWCQLRRGNASVMLAIVPDPAGLAPHQQYMTELGPRVQGAGGPVSLYLHVDDVDAAYATAIDAGAEPVEDIWDAWWGGRQFTVADPDGNWWSFFQTTE